MSQFVGELKKTRYRESMSLAAMASRQASVLSPTHPPTPPIHCRSGLTSCVLSQTLCINKDVQKLASSSRINEKCLDLQQAKSKASSKVDI